MIGRGLIAALVALLIPALAQAQSSTALQEIYKGQNVITTNTTVASAGDTGFLGPFQDPGDVVALDFEGPGAGATQTTGLSIDFVYSDTEAGPYSAMTDALTSGKMNSVAFTNENQFEGVGTTLDLFRSKWFKLKFKNAGAADYLLKRLTLVRKAVNQEAQPRPHQLVYDAAAESGIAAQQLADTAEVTSTKVRTSPREITSATLDGSGAGAGAQLLHFYYSNSEKGPFTAWEDDAATGSQNSVTATADDATHHLKLMPALFVKMGVKNSSGAAYDVTKVSYTRQSPVRR